MARLDEILVEIQKAGKDGNMEKIRELTKEAAKLERGQQDAEKAKREEMMEGFKAELGKAGATLLALGQKAKDMGLKKFGVMVTMDESGKWGANPVAGGTGRKASGAPAKTYSISTAELLRKHGSKKPEGETKTYQELYDSDKNGNFRFGIRKALLKAEGLM